MEKINIRVEEKKELTYSIHLIKLDGKKNSVWKVIDFLYNIKEARETRLI